MFFDDTLQAVLSLVMALILTLIALNKKNNN